MGRGLSELQRYIVTKAATVGRLYTHDILQVVPDRGEHVTSSGVVGTYNMCDKPVGCERPYRGREAGVFPDGRALHIGTGPFH